MVSLHCTWAGLIRAGALTGVTYKQHETRSRSGAIGKDYRGWIAIASTANPKQPDWDVIKQVAELAGDETTKNRLRDFDLYEPGHILALARVTDAFEMTPENIATQSLLELATGDWQPGRWAFRLEGAIALPQLIPYTAKGQGAPYVELEGDLGQQLLSLINTFRPTQL
ncbi:MAG TPA: hypothetical protein V6D33_12100 [Cyanophyceae cyanobacterium]